VAPIDSVYGTLDLVKAKITQQYADQSKLREEIEGAGSYTMFAPSDDAWKELDPVSRIPGHVLLHSSRSICMLCLNQFSNVCVINKHTWSTEWNLLKINKSVYLQALKAAMVSSGNTELYNALHYHMVNKRLVTKDLKNDMTLKSMYNKQGLYINHYSNGVSFSFLQIYCVCV